MSRRIHRWCSWAPVLGLALVACGGSSPKKSSFGIVIDPNAPEHWRTDQEWRLVSQERCATGPFEIEIPARDFEFGRRVVVSIHGRRGFEIDHRMDFSDGSSSSGKWAMRTGTEAEHAHCRAKKGEVARAVSGGGAPPPESPPYGNDLPPGVGTPPVPPTSGKRPPPTPKHPSDPPSSETTSETGPPVPEHVPRLVAYGGTLDMGSVTRAAWAWMPLGNPLTDVDIRMTVHDSDRVKSGLRLRLWFSKPTDTSGMVFVVTDQRLVPKGDLAKYRAEFSGRVATAEAWRAKQGGDGARIVDRDAECARSPDRSWCWPIGRVPPPPRKEERPALPASNVAWLPGYWSFDRGLDDFVWVQGTFVVRGPPRVARPEPPKVQASAPPAPVTPAEPVAKPMPPPPPEPIPEPPAAPKRLEPVVVAAKIPPRPQPKREAVPAPPAVTGVVWVPGYWKLSGVTWSWVRGRWHKPRRRGARFRAPSVNVRGRVRIYLPGGWVIGRRR